jgi:hypothetical protein
MSKKKLPHPSCEYLPKNIIEKMKNQTIQSKKDGLEHGFTICSSSEYWGDMNDKNTVASEKCIGTACKISVTKEEVKKSCPSDTKDLAYFHTHPKRDISLPSFDDIISMHALEHNFACIGSKTEIRCFSQNIPASRAYMDIPSREYDRFKKQWELHAEDCIISLL